MKLFGYDINIFKTPKSVGKSEVGKTGTPIFGGYIQSDEYVTNLTGTQGLITYNEMRKSDGVVRAALLACELPIRAAKWYVEPASEDKADVEVAEFVSQSLFETMTITWDDFLRQALLMLPFGFSVFEKVFGMVEFEGRDMIGWKKLSPRLQGSILKWETENGGSGITQRLSDGGEASIPMEKLLIFVNNKEGDNWTGISLLRNAYRAWYMKSVIEKINAISFERQGLGIPYGKLPKNYSPADRALMETLLKNIRANEEAFIIEPEGWEVGFKDMMSKGVKDPTATVARYNREILMSVLAQFLDLGSTSTGSFSLSEDQSAIFHNNLTAIARQVADVLNKYAIKQLVDLNYTVKDYPKLKFSNIGVVPYTKISEALARLVEKGVVTADETLEDSVRQLFNLPEKDEVEEVKEKKEPTKEPKEKDIKPEKKKASEFVGWRALTFAEKKVNFADIESKMISAEKKLKTTLSQILKKSSSDLLRQIQLVMEEPKSADRTERLNKLAVKYRGEYRSVILNSTKEIFQYGKTMAAHEMKKTPPPTPATSVQAMSKNSDVLTNTMESDLIKAGTLALSLATRQKQTTSKTISLVKKALSRSASNALNNVPTITVSSAINQGRRATFDTYQDDIYGLQRSEILDAVTCNYCMSIDKRVFKQSDSFTKNDGIHSNCRGIWVEILKDETDKPDKAGIPKSLRERFETINVFAPPPVPILDPGSVADRFYEKTQLQEDVKKKIDKIYKVAPRMKEQIDEMSDSIAAKFEGAVVAKEPLKKYDTAFKKVMNRKGGDVAQLKDVARNTVIVMKEEDVPRVVESLREMGTVTSENIYIGTENELGYSGINLKVMTNDGYEAEIQINTPEMIWGKELAGTSKSILGDDLWEEVKNKVNHTKGIEAGNGHKYYEDIRALEVSSRESVDKTKLSKEYYDTIRQRWQLD